MMSLFGRMLRIRLAPGPARMMLVLVMLLPAMSLAQADFINVRTVTLKINATDNGCGIGTGAQMKLSNDGQAWSAPQPFTNIVDNWDLNSHGGGTNDGEKTVYAMVSDACGNWTETIGPATISIDTTPPTVTIEIVVTIGPND